MANVMWLGYVVFMTVVLFLFLRERLGRPMWIIRGTVIALVLAPSVRNWRCPSAWG